MEKGYNNYGNVLDFWFQSKILGPDFRAKFSWDIFVSTVES